MKKNQAITLTEILARGWTIAQAARATGYSNEHIRQVVRGQRISKRAQNALNALPKRELKLRRPVDA